MLKIYFLGILSVTGYPGVWGSVKISGLNSSVGKALTRYTRGLGFESRLRLEFLPPAAYGAQR